MSWEMYSSNTTFQAASCKTIIANLRELASAEDKHAKTYQKIQEALQAISYMYNWHSAMLQNASETAAIKRRFASSLVSNVVLPLQDHVHNYRNQTRQVFYEMRSSYEVLATRERYIKACKAAEAAIRARNTAMDKLNDLELQAKKATPSSQLPPLALLEAKKNVQGLDGLNQRIKATLDESVAAKEVYIQSDMTYQTMGLMEDMSKREATLQTKIDALERDVHEREAAQLKMVLAHDVAVSQWTAKCQALEATVTTLEARCAIREQLEVHKKMLELAEMKLLAVTAQLHDKDVLERRRIEAENLVGYVQEERLAQYKDLSDLHAELLHLRQLAFQISSPATSLVGLTDLPPLTPNSQFLYDMLLQVQY
ncbi:hypothetical protein DYB26_013129 [Aphanomyces astaci]|uniref:FCH domain-containing protein n=1 Tax=Aphanomyces astaci TaxID=112090 RepID=A0A418FU08_APHAT|nr:hypothetical protein DYB26_013129 [Aphanomyces astaci]